MADAIKPVRWLKGDGVALWTPGRKPWVGVEPRPRREFSESAMRRLRFRARRMADRLGI